MQSSSTPLDNDTSENVASKGVYVLDNVPSLHNSYPMVEDADSSQMSALIDILKGQNMVVEGPCLAQVSRKL